MHIVVIAWLFVAALMAMTLSSAVAGIAWFALVGVLPMALLVWMTARRRVPRGDRSDR
jgi:membrane protein implicated in regulation of membrane protease activity